MWIIGFSCKKFYISIVHYSLNYFSIFNQLCNFSAMDEKSKTVFFKRFYYAIRTLISTYHRCVIQNHLSVFLSLCTKLNNVQSMNLISTQWSMLYMRPLGHLESDLKSFPNAIPIPKLIPPNLPHHVWDFSSSQTLHCYHWSLITHLLSIWMSFLWLKNQFLLL